ncbi:hypothetical protein OVA03_11550 [Asticcacaulis sp. SL142]|uniref:hypothetical protein n=1 Tax=Asticcacaulis sp. SL142 TaxID=2995155 RepID=UPI00226D0E43|nr:hypothetical protein [Asticcacaulis sp. SL142]WAC47338.1 hypothetical protein OVA03_11550 [Asticcacaulis sp. SL142]
MLFIVTPTAFVFGIVGALIFFPWKNKEARIGLPKLLLLLIAPFLAFLWGRLFGVEPGTLTNSQWMSDILIVLPIVSIILTIIVAYYTKGMRAFTAMSGIAVTAFTMFMCLLSAMAVSGSWI